jgi:uncharacterized protein with PQ loop repeat
MTQAIGWLAATILVLTIGKQVYKQWKEETSEGVSLYLFLGQLAANALFLTYASLTGDAVFIVANGLLLVTSLLGLGIKWKHTRAKRRAT